MIHNSKSKGFTLIEVLVAATIVAVLAAVGLASYSSATKRSRDAKRRSDIEQIRAALEMYRTDTGSYVVSSGGPAYNELDDAGELKPQYMGNIPRDPVGTNEYRYEGSAYSYCLRAALEKPTASDVSTCSTCASPYNYCIKNP